MKVCVITATKNRHTALERSLGFFLGQTYVDSIQLIFNNSCENLSLDDSVPSGKVVLINNCISYETGKSYTNLGQIYRDAIKHVPKDVDVISFWDDDDIFLPDHIEQGVKGLLKGGKTAYKPKQSYYRGRGTFKLVENTLEPSIFVKKFHVEQYGFSDTTTEQHLQWVTPLINNGQIFVDPDGKPTLIYNWGDSFPTFKTSGDPNNPMNFLNYERNSTDKGDGVITPMTEIQKYFI